MWVPKRIGQLRFIYRYGQRRKGAGAWDFKGNGDCQVVEESRTHKAGQFLLDNPKTADPGGGLVSRPPARSFPVYHTRFTLGYGAYGKISSLEQVFPCGSLQQERGRVKQSFWVLITSLKSVSPEVVLGWQNFGSIHLLRKVERNRRN